MTPPTVINLRRRTVVVGALLLVALGAAVASLLMRGAPPRISATPIPADTPSPTQRASARPTEPGGTLPDVVVPIPADVAARAGITTAPVMVGTGDSQLRLPAVIEPNAYRAVAVTPLVGGRVTRINVQLGDRVRRGQVLAEIYSPELADAYARYVSARAELNAHDRELQRTQKLAEIGAASRQELERVHAAHATQQAAEQSARSRLELLGVSGAALDQSAGKASLTTTVRVPAPIDGVVTERTANIGLNVDPASALFTIVDLSTVWVVADVHEGDLARVRVGSAASVTTPAFPAVVHRGRVTYMDPQVEQTTRTAKIRIEVPNPRAELRLGMFADVIVSGNQQKGRPVVPRRAVQNVGARTVIYLTNPAAAGTFIEREVQLGTSSGDQIEVLSGVGLGEQVVTEGSFFVRAEVERLGLRATTNTAPAPEPSGAGANDVQSAKIAVNEQGFSPAEITLSAGRRARLTFVRTSDKTCATEVVVPSLELRRALPLNEPVPIEFTPKAAGPIAFSCGMNMLKGTAVVR